VKLCGTIMILHSHKGRRVYIIGIRVIIIAEKKKKYFHGVLHSDHDDVGVCSSGHILISKSL